MKTLLLDQTTWDICLDANGNLAIADDPYSVAQDVASACRLFLGELWYNTSVGVPYLQQILGRFPSLSVVKTQLVAAALTVPGVTNPVCFVIDYNQSTRKFSGQIQFTDSNTGTIQVASF